MSRILVLGCGELAWGRPSTSSLFGRQWNRGRLSEKIGLGADGPQFGDAAGEDWVTLAEELDRRRAWRPADALGPAPQLTALPGEPVQAPLLPTWGELALRQARWVTGELGGAGVLVTPRDWLELPPGRQLLEVWASEGWTWAPLELVLRKRFSAGACCVAASGLWLRVMQRDGACVLANGPEAARAVEITSAVLDFALAQVEESLARRWRQEEAAESGWYVQQQWLRRLTGALKEGRKQVELSGALFRFATAEARERYRALSALRIAVALPGKALSWWERVSEAGFLRSPAGAGHPGIRWGDRKTVLLEGGEIRQLASHMAFRGFKREEVDPARLEEALELGSPLPPPPKSERAPGPPPVASSTPTPERADSPPPPPPLEPAPPMAIAPERAMAPSPAPAPSPSSTVQEGASAEQETMEVDVDIEEPTVLADFKPQQFTLEAPHRLEQLRVWIDGQRVEQGNIRRSQREGIYTIEGISVPHGAIVRVDFQPLEEELQAR